MEYLTKAFSVGTDSEMFCMKDNEFVAVQNCGIKGTKKAPQWLSNGGNVQRDNVAVEFATAPARSKMEFIQSVGSTLQEVIKVLPANVSINIIPSADFPRGQLNHEECKQFACDPDRNAWTLKENEKPEGAEDGVLRSAAAHLHVGYVEGSKYTFLRSERGKIMFIRTLDLFPGMVSTVLDSSEAAIARKKLYGKAGCYRATDYGVEYRTMSNFWIKTPKLVELMYNLTADALEFMMAGSTVARLIKYVGIDHIQRVITEGDKVAALNIIDDFIYNSMSKESRELYDWSLTNIENINFMREWEEIK